MPRIQLVDPATAEGRAKELLDGLPKVLNVHRALAASPAVLEAYLGISGALKLTLNLKTRESIALTVAQENECEYCLAVHTANGGKAGLSEQELLAARQASSSDAKRDAALKFALAVVRQHGGVSDADLAAVKAAGYSEGEVVEVIGLVVQNIFTNYINKLAPTPVDFPPVDVHAVTKAP